MLCKATFAGLLRGAGARGGAGFGIGSGDAQQVRRFGGSSQAVKLRIARKVPPAAETNAMERNAVEDAHRAASEIAASSPAPQAHLPLGALLVRKHNCPALAMGALPTQAYAAHPHNFTPLRPVQPGFGPMDRAVRDIAWESRFDLLERVVEPRYASECIGTPRRELQDGMVGGVRVRPVQNPYVRLRPSVKYRLNAWPSKDWKNWSPLRVNLRGGRRKYRVPDDLAPYRDELGEWHPPRVSGRYKADIEKQYYMHSLPWVWSNDYYQGTVHFMDREPRGKKFWFKKQFRMAQMNEALKHTDQLIKDYRKERRDKKRLSWIETMVLEFAGEQIALPYVRTRKLPKM